MNGYKFIDIFKPSKIFLYFLYKICVFVIIIWSITLKIVAKEK